MGKCLSVPVKISNRGVACNHVDREGREVTVVEVALDRVGIGNGLLGGERSGAGHVALNC